MDGGALESLPPCVDVGCAEARLRRDVAVDVVDDFKCAVVFAPVRALEVAFGREEAEAVSPGRRKEDMVSCLRVASVATTRGDGGVIRIPAKRRE